MLSRPPCASFVVSVSHAHVHVSVFDSSLVPFPVKDAACCPYRCVVGQFLCDGKLLTGTGYCNITYLDLSMAVAVLSTPSVNTYFRCVPHATASLCLI